MSENISLLTHLATAVGVLGLLTIVPGPDMAVVTRRAHTSGTGDALRTVGGAAAGCCSGVRRPWPGSRRYSPSAYPAVRLLGAGDLVFLGAQSLWQHRRGATVSTQTGTPTRAGNPGRTGLVSNALHPKIAVSCTGLPPCWPRPGCRPPGP
jgi:threonine/homoserine/homoserine lactone efflux protein